LITQRVALSSGSPVNGVARKETATMLLIEKADEILKNQLTNEIKQKFTSLRDNEVSQLLDFLLINTKAKLQAFAVVGALTVQEMKTLAEKGLYQLPTNNQADIKSAALAGKITGNGVHEVSFSLETRSLTQRIEEYANNVKTEARMLQHQKDMLDKSKLPFKEDGQIAAQYYNNSQSFLPRLANDKYIEWYPFIGTTRSKDKRFFTAEDNEKKKWYTEGGTHKTSKKNYWFVKNEQFGFWELWKIL